MNVDCATLPDSTNDASTVPTGPTTLTPKPRRARNGKIARLPKKLRIIINDMLDDGATHAQIAQRLKESADPPLPYDISERNISGWHNGGFQDWLRHQDHMDILTARLDFAIDLAQNSHPEQLQALTLQLAAIRLCEFLAQSAIADSQQDPSMYLRLLSALPRISKETLNLQKYRDELQKTASLQIAAHETNPDQADAIRSSLLDKMDDIMGLKSYRALPGCRSSRSPSAPPTEGHGNPRKENPAPAVNPLPAIASAEPSELPVEQVGARAHNETARMASAGASQLPVEQASLPAGAVGVSPGIPPEIKTNESKTHDPSTPNQQSEIEIPKPPTEFCLQCRAPLPPRRPNGSRPVTACHQCGVELPTFTCFLPSLEQCPRCKRNLPRPHASGQRPHSGRCHLCTAILPDPSPEVLATVRAYWAERDLAKPTPHS